MIKKTLLIATSLIFMTACGAEKQTSEASINADSQTTSEKTKETIQSLEKPIEEEQIEPEPLNLVSLENKIWSNFDESLYVYFTEISEDRIDLRLLQTTESSEVQEQTLTALINQHNTESWGGTITSETAQGVSTSHNPELVIEFNNDVYELTIGDSEKFALHQSTLTQEEWNEKKSSLKELSDFEVISLIQEIENQSLARFSEAFNETTEGYSYLEDFQTILSSLEDMYTYDFQSVTLREIYDNPYYMVETLYAFPLAGVHITNYQILRTPEQMTVYTESGSSEFREYLRYRLVVDDKKWKISSRETLVSPDIAIYSTLSISGEDADPDAYAKLVHTPNFNEIVQMVQNGERYSLTTHLDYDDIQVDVWKYQVDPVSGMVYSVDDVIDRAIELGSIFDEQ